MSTADDIFDAADVVEFDVFGVPATYRPKAGAAVAVTVVRSRLERIDGPTLVETEAVDIRVAEVAGPVEGDVVEIGGCRFAVAALRRDPEQLVWTLGLKEMG